MVVIPTETIRRMVENVLFSEPLVVRLFKNDYIPSDDGSDTVDNFTEADFAGYEPASLAKDKWNVTTNQRRADAIHVAKTFISSARQPKQDIYGYYITGTDSGNLYWAGRFEDGPMPIQYRRDVIVIEPEFSHGIPVK